MSDVVNIVAVILFLSFWGLVVKRFAQARCTTLKTVKAEVVDKYKSDVVSKYPTSFRGERCVVVFATKDKRLSFNVSEFSYNNYKIREKGTLKYKGTKIISFK